MSYLEVNIKKQRLRSADCFGKKENKSYFAMSVKKVTLKYQRETVGQLVREPNCKS